MKRLTNNELSSALENGYFVSIDSKAVPVPTVEDIYIKLSKYEKIEEKLGIDLITLFKALKNGIFFLIDHKYLFEDSNNNAIKDFIKLDSFDLLEKSFQVDSGYILSLYDYGKTWALTKEELEDDK